MRGWWSVWSSIGGRDAGVLGRSFVVGTGGQLPWAARFDSLVCSNAP